MLFYVEKFQPESIDILRAAPAGTEFGVRNLDSAPSDEDSVY